jgi:hypothetical protein
LFVEFLFLTTKVKESVTGAEVIMAHHGTIMALTKKAGLGMKIEEKNAKQFCLSKVMDQATTNVNNIN